MWHKAEHVGSYLSEDLGSQQQKVVGLLMTNSIDFASAYFAVVQSGHIAMPIDPIYKKLEIDAIVKQLKPDMVIVQSRYISQISSNNCRIIDSEGLLKKISNTKKPPLRMTPETQIASLTFTSGTSGKPKSVPNTHSNQIWSVVACSKVWNWTSDDNLLLTLPLSHWYGIVMGLAGAVYHGNTIYLRQQSFDADDILQTLASGKISLFTHTPIGYTKFLETIKDYNLSGVRLMISGSAPLPPRIWRQVKERFGVEVLEAYGSSETGRIAANSHGNIMLGSAGVVLPGVDLKLSKDNEVLIKSDGVCPGYWQNADATNQATTKDGYWRTGDIGEIKDGHLILKGRAQESIRRFGYTISPRDIEWALLENPKIKQVLVVGQQTKQTDDRLFYFIVGDITKDEINDYSKLNLPFNWRADDIFILDTIPRNRSGKPKIAELKQIAGGKSNA